MFDEVWLGVCGALVFLVVVGAIVFAYWGAKYATATAENAGEARFVIVKAVGSSVLVALVVSYLLYVGGRVPEQHQTAAFLAAALAVGVPVAWGLRTGWIVRREVARYAQWLGEDLLENRRLAARGLLQRAWAARPVRAALVAADREGEDPVVRWLIQESLRLNKEPSL